MATSTPAIESQEADEAKLALEGLEDEDKGKDEGEGKEAKTEEELAAEAAMAERLKPVEKEDGTVETDEEAKTRVEAEDAAAVDAAKEPTEVEKLTGEIKDLRQMLRTSKRDQVQMQAKVDRLEKRPVKTGGEEEEGTGEEEGNEDESLSRVEELQRFIGQVGKERGAALDILLETMEQGAYKDIREVCSRGNFDDIFEAIASEASKETGKDYDEILLEAELDAWTKENPYKYMYDLIRKYHPSYTEKDRPAKPGEKGKKEPSIVDAPKTIADKGGDADIKGGWTSKRIDDLPEDELGTVPVDVYEKYMQGRLD